MAIDPTQLAVQTATNTAKAAPKVLSLQEKAAAVGKLTEKEVRFAQDATTNGRSPDEVMDIIYKARGNPQPPRSTMQKAKDIGGAVVDSALGLAKVGAAGADKLLSAADKYIVDPVSRALGADEATIQKNTAEAQKARQNVRSQVASAGKKVGADTASPYYKYGKLGADIIQGVVTGGGGKVASAVASRLPSQVPAIAGRIAGGAIEGLTDTVSYAALSDQRLPTKNELKWGVGLGAGVPVVAAGVSEASPYIKKIVDKVVAKSDKTDDIFAKTPKINAKMPNIGQNMATTYEEAPKTSMIDSILDSTREKLGVNAVDDMTRTAFKDGQITVPERQKAKTVAQRASKDINAKSGFETLADDIEEATKKYVSKPKEKIGKQIGDIKQAMKEGGIDLAVDNKPALDELDRVLETYYNARMTPDGIVPAQGGVHKLIGDDLEVLAELQKDLQNVKEANDITLVFEKANDLYESILKKQARGSADPRLVRNIGKIREKLEQQLDAIMGPKYKALRLQYRNLSNLEKRFENLFQRNKPGMTDEQYTTIGKIKKLFSPDKGAVMDDFKMLKEITGIDFASRAQMYKFLAEQFGDSKSLSLLGQLESIKRGVRDLAWDFGKRRVEGDPLEVATRIVSKLNNVSAAKKPRVVKSVKSVINKINKSAEKVSKKRAEDMIQAAIQKELAEKAKQEAVEATAKKVEELKNMPGARKVGAADRLGAIKDASGEPRYMTVKGPVEQTFFDRGIQKMKVGGQTYGFGDLDVFEVKPTNVAGDTKAEQGTNVLWTEAKKALKKIQGSTTSKTMGANLRAVLDDLGIKSVDDIPDGAEQEVLKMVRARKPKGGGAEILEQNPMVQGVLRNIRDDVAYWRDKFKEAGPFKTAEEAMNSKEYKELQKAMKANQPQKVTKTSNNLYHTTSAENAQSIASEGLVPGKKQRFEGVGSKNKLSFGANEATASYYGKPGDVMIRTKAGYKPTTLDYDLLGGGEGTYTVSESIPPDQLEIKVGSKRIPMKEYLKSKT